VNDRSTISRRGMTLPMSQVEEFWRRWKIREPAIFGSYLRDDFGPHSDIHSRREGRLVTFLTWSGWTKNSPQSLGVLSISSTATQLSRVRIGFDARRFWARRRSSMRI
jgi:hypothetical protein